MTEKMEKKHNHHHQYIAFGSTPSKPKYTTRHLAALDFLLNINMSKEEEIRRVGMQTAIKTQQMEEREQHHNDNESIDENAPGQQNQAAILSAEEILASQNELAGKKLLGPHAAMGRYPLTFRYHLQRLTDQSALCRQWEDKMIKSTAPIPSTDPAATVTNNTRKSQTDPTLFESRVFYSRSRSYPIMVASFIKYDAGEEKAKLEKMKADDQKGMEVFELPERDWRGFSYKPYFKQLSEERAGDFYFEKGLLYDPNTLDDPDLRYGCHRYVLQRSKNTGPILSSIITYVNKKDLKETLNEQFREKHPQLPPSLTLSKIRNCKKETVVFGVQIGLELSCLALAMINFERLCLKGLVTKYNRKLSMAVSLILAFKFHEDGFDANKKKKELLMDFFDKEWDLPPGDIYEAEFGALVHLGFLLHVPYQHLHVVYTRLLNMLNRTSIQYLGEDMLETYHNDVKQHEMEIEQIRLEKERAAEAEAEAAAAAEAAAVAAEEAIVAAALAAEKQQENSNALAEEIAGESGADGEDGTTKSIAEREHGGDDVDSQLTSDRIPGADAKKKRPTKILSSLGMLYKQPSKIFRSQPNPARMGSSSTNSTPARGGSGGNGVSSSSANGPMEATSGNTATATALSLQHPHVGNVSHHSLMEQSVDGESVGFLSSSGGASPAGSLSSPMMSLSIPHPFPASIMARPIISDEDETPMGGGVSGVALSDTETYSTATEPPLSFMPTGMGADDDDVGDVHSEPPAHHHHHGSGSGSHHHHRHRHHHHHHHHHHHRRHSTSSTATSSGGHHHRHSSGSNKEVSFAPNLILESTATTTKNGEHATDGTGGSSSPGPSDGIGSQANGNSSSSGGGGSGSSNGSKLTGGGIVSSLFFRRRSHSSAGSSNNLRGLVGATEASATTTTGDSPITAEMGSVINSGDGVPPSLASTSRTPSPPAFSSSTTSSLMGSRTLLPVTMPSFLMRTTSVEEPK